MWACIGVGIAWSGWSSLRVGLQAGSGGNYAARDFLTLAGGSALAAGVIVVAVAVAVVVVGTAVVRRREWALLVAAIMCSAFAVLSLLAVGGTRQEDVPAPSGATTMTVDVGVSPVPPLVSAAANAAIVVLVLLPSTRRDIRAAEDRRYAVPPAARPRMRAVD